MFGRRRLAVSAEYEDQAGYVAPVLVAPGGNEDRRSLHITLTGTLEEQRDVADEMAQGYRCANCIEPFPAPPSLRTVALFREVYGKNPADLLDKQLALVAQECCPMCGWEVRPEMVDMLALGDIPDPVKE